MRVKSRLVHKVLNEADVIQVTPHLPGCSCKGGRKHHSMLRVFGPYGTGSLCVVLQVSSGLGWRLHSKHLSTASLLQCL